MDIWRRIGIAIVCGVPAIIGGGLLWQLSKSWQVVGGYLGLLGFILLVFVCNPEQIVNQIRK
ncbi:MAG: hypothetical protein JRI89_15455 [Deltaproteobacteria bacterium]|nr:hypothetical protein [Deltaproteobacteria bacterium]